MNVNQGLETTQDMVIYSEQPQPGQPLRIEFDRMRSFQPSIAYPQRLPCPISSGEVSCRREGPAACESTIQWAPERMSSKPIPIDAMSQCSESTKRRRRLQRRRYQEYPKEMALSGGLRPLKLGRQTTVDEVSVPLTPYIGPQPDSRKKYPPTPLPPGFMWGSEEQPLRPLPDLTIPPMPSPFNLSRRNTVESRYSLDSAFNSPDSPTISRSDSLYRKAVLALPRSTQFFLDSLDENPPMPPAPLKIRPGSKSSTISRRQGSGLNTRCQSGFEEPREWEMGWEDFDTILDEWQSGVEEDDTNAFCTAGPTSTIVPTPGPYPSTLGHSRSKWSDTSSGLSRDSLNIQYNELSIPPLAHLPDLEPDRISNASSPSSRGPRTPFSPKTFPPYASNSMANRSHLSLCLADPGVRIPYGRHVASQSVDNLVWRVPYAKGKQKESLYVNTVLDLADPLDTANRYGTPSSSTGGRDTLVSPLVSMYHPESQGRGNGGLEQWSTMKDFGTPF